MKSYLYVIGLFLLITTACNSSKKVIGLQNGDTMKIEEIVPQEIHIQQNDLLGITVNSKNAELALPFNMPTVAYQAGTNGNVSGTQALQGYLVDEQGNINFPILGTIHVEGLTRSQLTHLLEQKLKNGNYIKDPVVTVKFLNFKISVIGEVNQPGSFPISNERVTILDALSMAGDLTIYGKRDRVAVIREIDGKRSITYNDLRNTDLFKSPTYYLQQNDVIYVEPNSRKAEQQNINQNNSIGVWISILSFLTTLGILIFK